MQNYGSPAIGYIKQNNEAGTVPVYQATCYSSSGGCAGYGLTREVNGSPVGYLSQTPPDAQSASMPFIQNRGMLFYGLTGTPEGYLWGLSYGSPGTPSFVDHFYSNDFSQPTDYAAQDIIGYLRLSSSGGGATVELRRYYNSTTQHYFYGTSSESPPSGFSQQAVLGYLDTSNPGGSVQLYRHYHSTTGDYLLNTSSTPPAGYSQSTALGYLQQGTGSTTPSATYVRNPLGQVLRVASPEVTYDYTYDTAHRMASITDSRGNKQISYGYNRSGQRTAMIDSHGNRTDYRYDPVGRLAGIWAANNEGIAFSYDDAGRLMEKWFPNGVNTQYTYNQDNTLKQLVNRHGSGSIMSQHDYSYDPFGNRQTHSETINGANMPYKYIYDELNRLKEVRNNTSNALIESYGYDFLNNRTSKSNGVTATSYVHDMSNRLTEIRNGVGGPLVGGIVYDANGNMVRKCEGGTVTVNASTCGGTTTLDMIVDGFNRVGAVVKNSVSSEEYAYDPDGRRIQKKVAGVPTNFLYDGSDIVAEFDGSWTNPAAVYTHGGGIDDPIMRATGTTAKYFHQDGLGSVVGVTNQSGIVDATVSYDAWGVKLSSSGTIPQYGYTGREPDTTTGLIYYRARYYDAAIARFTQRDPIGMSGGLNLYAYASANPITLNDPLGLTPANPSNLITTDISYVANRPQGQSSACQCLYRVDLDERGIPTQFEPVDLLVTTHLAINGIRQNLDEAVRGMAAQVHGGDPNVRSFTLFHNPTQGGAADLWEATRDKLGFTTAITQQFVGVLQQIQANGVDTKITAYSQGGLILAEGARVHTANGGGSLSNISSVQCNGCPNNNWASNRIFASAGIAPAKFDANPLDFMPNILGLNTANPVRIVGSVLAFPFLFSESSPLNHHRYPLR